MGKLHRRDVLRCGVQVVSAVAVMPLVSACAKASQYSGTAPAAGTVADSDTCVDPSGESLRASLEYTDPSPDADRPCRACAFFSADEDSSCGHCMIMSGSVSATAWCDSWSPKG